MLRKTIISIVLIAVVLGIAAAFCDYLIKNKPQPERHEVKSNAPLVSYVVLHPENVREVLYGYGTARADRQATLAAEINAPVLELVNDLNTGVAVEKGQLLVRLDDRQYQQDLLEAESLLEARDAGAAQLRVEQQNLAALLEIANADLIVNKEEFDRMDRLRSEDRASSTEYNLARLKYQAALRAKQQLDNQIALLEPARLRIKAEKTAAVARAERAKLNIDRCSIKAPFAGQVSALNVDQGDRVRIGSEILRISNLDIIELPLEIPVSVHTRLSIGAKVTAYVESFPDQKWEGVISRMSPVASERSRTIEVYVEIDNRKQQVPLVPGYFVKAEVEGPMIENALVVPRTAVVGGYVYVANDRVVHKHKVEVDRYLNDHAVLSGTIQSGDHVITTNLELLYEGCKVRYHGDEINEQITSPAKPEGEGSGNLTSNGEESK